ncbi:MAG: trehalase-like domain-containing protein, partial [Candidatus Acidiferrum sp.]
MARRFVDVILVWIDGPFAPWQYMSRSAVAAHNLRATITNRNRHFSWVRNLPKDLSDREQAGQKQRNSAPQPIEDYGVIGDLNTVALVGADASIDFLCLPHFDSPTVFAKLLDHEKGGSFSIEPKLDQGRSKQMYLPETNILTTRFQSQDGVAEIDDFMPALDADEHRRVIRAVRVIKGTIDFGMRCCPRFDYGRKSHTVELHGEHVVEFIVPDGLCPPVRLISRIPLRVVGRDVEADFTLKAGEHLSFIFACGVSEESPQDAERDAQVENIKRWFDETSKFWRAWAAKSSYKGRWREMVTSSALVLKLLTSRKHGSIIAAPTFGLPELVGGERNWDYRYTWLRDSAFTLYAFMRLGYTDEARSFMMWLRERIGK